MGIYGIFCICWVLGSWEQNLKLCTAITEDNELSQVLNDVLPHLGVSSMLNVHLAKQCINQIFHTLLNLC